MQREGLFSASAALAASGGLESKAGAERGKGGRQDEAFCELGAMRHQPDIAQGGDLKLGTVRLGDEDGNELEVGCRVDALFHAPHEQLVVMLPDGVVRPKRFQVVDEEGVEGWGLPLRGPPHPSFKD